MSIAPARRAAPALLTAAALLLVGLAAAGGARAGWLSLKASVAQVLLERAWSATLADAVPARPWPWADIVPVARLGVPTLGRSLVVLQDASGEAMAFGPGLVTGSARHADAEAIALGGHRDSHLAFLEHLELGAPLTLDGPDGRRHRYRLAEKRIVDSSRGEFAIAHDMPALVLITCYPFGAAQTGGPLRLLAVALPEAAASDAPARALAAGERVDSASNAPGSGG